jgi:hypothetical protein
MSFWFLFGACYATSILVTHRFLSREARKRFRMTVVFSELALTSILLVLFGGSRTWTMIPLGPGPAKEITNLVTPGVLLFVIATVLAVSVFCFERRRK